MFFLVLSDQHCSIYGSTALVDFRLFFSFVMYTQTLELLGRGISPSQGRHLHTEQHKQNKRIQTSMPGVGFEPTIPVFERAKTVHTLDHAATVIGPKPFYQKIYIYIISKVTLLTFVTCEEVSIFLLAVCSALI
jgi:hypothetical protein